MNFLYRSIIFRKQFFPKSLSAYLGCSKSLNSRLKAFSTFSVPPQASQQQKISHNLDNDNLVSSGEEKFSLTDVQLRNRKMKLQEAKVFSSVDSDGKYDYDDDESDHDHEHDESDEENDEEEEEDDNDDYDISQDIERLREIHGSNYVERVQEIDDLGRSYGTGRRKTSVARVWIIPGSGQFVVNDRNLVDYFQPQQRFDVLKPFLASQTGGLFDVWCTVKGGGMSGQAGAVRLGISRALQNYDPSFHTPLKRRKSFMLVLLIFYFKFFFRGTADS
jgi:ribosomal protein S9